jgi:protocatechuate 3,4-dioxygenase beta subunit
MAPSHMRRLRIYVLIPSLALGAWTVWLLASREVHAPVPALNGATSERSAPPSASAEPIPEASIASARFAPAPMARRAVAEAPRRRAAELDSSAPRPVLAGIVMQPGGAPIAGADIELEADQAFRSALGPLASTRTDGEGRFELRTRFTGPFRLIATARTEGRITHQGTLESVALGRTDLVVVLPSTVVRGVVVDDAGAAVSDYRIAFTPLIDGEPSGQDRKGERVLGAGGAFTAELSPGEWRCSVVPRGNFVPTHVDLLVPALSAPTIVVERQAVLRGSVVDPAGRAVARATVEVPGRGSVTAKRDGGFVLEIAAGAAILFADHPDFASSELVELVLEPGEERDGIVLRLGELAHLSGEVLDSAGRPVAGREVRVVPPVQDRIWSGDDRFGGRAVTDEAGRFALDLRPGPLHVRIELAAAELAALGPRACVRSVTLAPGEDTHLRIALGGEPVRVHGRIELGGEPPESARVSLVGLGAWPSGSYSRGEYEVQVPGPGVYTFLVSAEGVDVQPTLDVPDVREMRHDFSIPSGRIAGSLRDDQGNALAEVTVDAYSEGHGHRTSSRAVTDRDGAYAFTLPPGRYRIAPREDFEEERAFLEPESVFVDVSEKDALANVDLVLTRTGALTGTVLTDRGVVLPRASVGAASVRAGHVSDVRADEHGRFLLPLDEGTYWLTADGSDGRSGFVTSEPAAAEQVGGAAGFVGVARLEDHSRAPSGVRSMRQPRARHSTTPCSMRWAVNPFLRRSRTASSAITQYGPRQ